MDEVAILVVKPGTLTGINKRQLKQAGVVVIETDDPDSVKYITPKAELSGSELLYAALVALDESRIDRVQEKMVSVMRQIMAKKMNAAATPTKP